MQFNPLCVESFGTSIFVIMGTFHGRQVRVLIDTGAGLSFISEALVKELNLDMIEIQPKQIKLGNAGVCEVNKAIDSSITLSDLTLDIQAHALTLPEGLDVIIGCPVLNRPDLWLQPSTRTLRILKDQTEHVLNCMEESDFFAYVQNTRPKEAAAAGVHILGSLSVSDEDSETAIPYDVEMLPKKQFDKLNALQSRGQLNWDSYTNNKVRGKHCAYASDIAKDRANFVATGKSASKTDRTTVQPEAAMLLINDDSKTQCLLTLGIDGQYALPHAVAKTVRSKPNKGKGRRPGRDKDKALASAAQYAATKLMCTGPGLVKLTPLADAGSNRIYAMDRSLSLKSIESSANAKFFAMDELPDNMIPEHRDILEKDVNDSDGNNEKDANMAYLCQLVLDPGIEQMAEADESALEAVLNKLRGSNRSKMAAEAATSMFDALIRQTEVKEIRKLEKLRIENRRLTGSMYDFNVQAHGKGWNTGTELRKSRTVTWADEDVLTTQIEHAYTMCTIAEKDLVNDMPNWFLPNDSAMADCKLQSGMDSTEIGTSRLLSHGKILAAFQVSDTVNTIIDDEDDDDWRRLHEMCNKDSAFSAHNCTIMHSTSPDKGSVVYGAMNPKSKFSDDAEVPKLDQKTVEQYMKGQYPIKLEEIDATVPEQMEWVAKMIAGDFGKMTCFDPVKKFVSNPEHEKAHFELIDGRTPRKPHRHRCPVHLMDVLKAWHKDMYSRNFIKPIMDASHLSPVLVIKKPDTPEGKSRGYRFVVAMVEINECLEPCENFTPSGDEIFDRLRNAMFISTTDLTDGYWVCELDDSTSRLCAFQSEFGSWAYRVLPQGAKPSAGIFSEFHSRILRRYGVLAGQEIFVDLDSEYEKQIETGATKALERGGATHKRSVPEDMRWRGEGFVEVMLDDALVHGKSAHEHRTQLLHYLRLCSREKLPVKLAKCTWFARYCRYLGIVVGSGHLLVDPLKILAIMKMVRPKNASELKGFIGAAGWTRKWIPSFAARQHLLNSLLKKGVIFKDKWSDDHTQAWLDLKKALMTYPVLRCFNQDLPVVVYSDSSQYHCGGAAVQFYPDPDDSTKQVPCVIAYHSRTFNDAESKYSSQEREMAGVVSCCAAFRHYLINSRFKVRCVSDHESLKYAQMNKLQINRIGRWTMKMSEYDYSIEYAKGATHYMADILSRAIEEPDSAWRKRAPIDNDDDFLSTPFMAFWPEVQYAYQCSTMMNPMEQFSGGVESAMPGSTNVNTPDSESPSASKATGSPVLASSFEFDTDYDEDLDDPEKQLFPHEKIIFGYCSIKPTPTRKVFREIDYLRCSDFGQIYQALVDSEGSRKQAARAALHRVDGTAKAKARYKDKDLPQVLKQYHIDGGYLYKSDRNHGHVLCVPDAMQSHYDMEYSDGLQKKISLRRLLFEELHSTPGAGHRGTGATELTLRRRYYWPQMCDHRRDKGGRCHDDSVTELIRRCPTCQMAKTDRKNPQGLLQPVQVPMAPAQSYNVDLIVGLPAVACEGGEYSKILVVVDRFSTWVRLTPTLTNTTATLLGEIFTDEIVLKAGRGIPLEIVSDRDPLMTSGFWRGLFKRFGTVLRFTAARNQQANGLAERTIATIADLLRTNINFDQRNWLELLPHIEFVLNATMKSSLGNVCPMMAEMGIQPLLPVDLVTALRGKEFNDGMQYHGRGNHSDPMDRIASLVSLRSDIRTAMLEVRAAMAEYGDHRRRNPDENITVGSEVWLKVEGLSFSTINNSGATKLKPRRYGPFKVLEQVSTNSYKLDIGDEATDSGVHDVFPVRLLRPYVHDPNRPRPDSISMPDAEDEVPYEVAEVLGERTKAGLVPPREYLVSWKGYSARYGRTWEPECNLTQDAFDILEDFVQKNGSDAARKAIATKRTLLDKAKAKTKAGGRKKKK